MRRRTRTRASKKSANYRPLTLSRLKRLSESHVKSLIADIETRLVSLNADEETYQRIVGEEQRARDTLLQQQRSLSREIENIKRDPASRESLLMRFIGQEYRPEAVARLGRLQREYYRLEDQLYQRIPHGSDRPREVYHMYRAGFTTTARRVLEFIKAERDILEKELPKYRAALERKSRQRGKGERLRAELAAARGRAREGTDQIKNGLPTDHPCPYCGGPLGNDYRADHIYPISKGGRSVTPNLINVCYQCNAKKRNLTLTAFIRKSRLNREEIEARLEKLGKEF